MPIYSMIDRFRDALAALGAETAYRYITREIVDVIHDEMIAQHGGSSGLRDENVLESALARPLNITVYGKTEDPTDMPFKLATSLCAGIARNHPFVDGNKRTAFVSMNVFLGMNGLRLDCDNAEVVDHMMMMASGTLDDEKFSSWLKRNTVLADDSAQAKDSPKPAGG